MQRRHHKSTMFLLLQNEQPQNYPHNQPCKLPGILKDLLPTSGPFKQKIEALLAFPEDEMFSLPLVELKTLLLYAADISQEQERLLNGRKGQLKYVSKQLFWFDAPKSCILFFVFVIWAFFCYSQIC